MKSTLFLALFLTIFANGALAAEPAAYPAGEADRQFAILTYDLAHRGGFKAKTDETLRADALILADDRDPLDVVLRRTTALLGDLGKPKNAPDLSVPGKELETLKAEAAKIVVTDVAARRTLFDRALLLRRRIALANPLLNFNELVFIKKHRAGFNHICDQYYGTTAQPGGGIFVLGDIFSNEPKLRDVLGKTPVTEGRLQGKPLANGAFLSPDLSYDGKSLLFAYVECQGPTTHYHRVDHTRGHWDPGRCFHLFKANMDGTGLVQLTDGDWNDFDPCWLPNGRVAFTSERRGGYLRCGRACPDFTLFDMKTDGKDIRCLSYHETNEWHPSVTNDGKIIWTRWDYVDRHGCTAHHPWIITPDGRDPRPVHGNYSLRHKRADAELDIRAIPDSPKFVATGAPHHGQAFGSLVLIDPWIKDDDRMSPVKRITPDVDFPESQGGREVYGEAWPLNEDYYLAVYDPAMQVPGLGAAGHYGLYLVDSFGNKELIYRDPAIGCHNPMPLRARPVPPIVPDQSIRVPENQPAEATVGVVNVYQSQKAWPEGTKIKALRVYQIFPQSVASVAISNSTGIQIPQGSDSINLARIVLGTVPVEADGSVYFIAPARRELFFQALDENGLAITSMRSSTQFQPGETALCQGCHEPRMRTPPADKGQPLAMQRPPSRLQPDVDGTNPFSYPRLIQPVLDKHCVTCHAKNPDKAPRLDTTPITQGGGHGTKGTFFASYLSLTPKYGFYNYGGRNWDDPKWYRTTPGEFGARASKLYPMLVKGHHDVKLTPEELHRFSVWLDSCSLFYGVYEKEGCEAQLKGGLAKPSLE
jgi:hypothetical protein